MGKFAIRRHYPTAIDFWITEALHGEDFIVEAQIQVSGGPNTDNPLDWRIETKVVFSAKLGETLISKGTLTFVGFFDAPDEVAEENRQNYMVQNGVSILYSATRELLANLTARAPNKIIILPPTFFGPVPPGGNVEGTQLTSVKT
jgi:preprotein translocase subunit SecB